jgi:N-hydroxyarylamine O-acetyltransferase
MTQEPTMPATAVRIRDRMPISPDTTARLLARIGLDRAPAPDAAGLRTVHRAFLSSVPYEALAVQLGESEPLHAQRLVEHMLAGGRGGYCFEINTVLLTLLRGLGFEVQRRRAIVGERSARTRGEPVNHMALVVRLPDGERFLADAGIGEGPLDPIPLREGPYASGPLSWLLERDGDGWWFDQHQWGAVPGFWMSDAPASLADFAAHHERQSTAPESSFVKTLVVQRPHADRIVTLRARTLHVDGPGVRARDVLPDAAAFAAALEREFGIDAGALGGARMARLWAQACAQHDAWLAQTAP